MSSGRAFKVLALIYRKVAQLGVLHDRSVAISRSLQLITGLDLPGSAGAVLAGFEAQGDDGACPEMCAHLRRLGVEPASLAEAALVWKAVCDGAQALSPGNPYYRTVENTYRRGLDKILRRMDEEAEAARNPPKPPGRRRRPPAGDPHPQGR